MRKRTKMLLLGAAAAAFVGTAIAAIGPTGPGQFYYYYDDSGRVVGYSAIHCDGTREAWGKATRNYADGVFLCDPDPY